MSDVRIAAAFDANLPNLDRTVRINSFYDAQVFVRRWAIRDKDRVIRALSAADGKSQQLGSGQQRHRRIETRAVCERLVARRGSAAALSRLLPEIANFSDQSGRARIEWWQAPRVRLRRAETPVLPTAPAGFQAPPAHAARPHS